ncbi:hypothetical protein HBH98_164740 [Parastagonospora nodorum]|uniref:RNase H type-1 domain-containing protein n=1 Tax=Phaeosphaeria nodorum (strain SN15 / ATCC MYA-4574 / FGSC 10173) TaxID=321614 RepID=Q0V0T8_PHANO|nr:hypothetical protein SNOG_02376 [Parastagonospora nodorum SN15]KAH3954511.1 hypothetical protein HBH53_023480 [Parastagonospora nodorum]EAT90588.2 hypothetical protein SNOG_02376 [Parastagonospora nodorum SN15]KAH3963833.1 hypothetical protein HBH51_163310 [Parastagonospora nodorum]KAH3967781.1 hypothetical protein HBH52_184990 [Parastagonospora nodorum]KAH3994564.1 hypothetical protein HBI10_184640 [Parastagonospora nodorum]
MVTTRGQHARRAQGIKGPASLVGKIKARAAKPPVPLQQNIPAAVQKHIAQLKHGGSKQAARARGKRLQVRILGANRVFSGSVYIPDYSAAREPDSTRLLDVAASMQAGHTIVYWCDGSAAQGFLGAGVAWTDSDKEMSEEYELGYNTGSSQDAELFAIAAALGQAKLEVQRGRDVQLVRIYTDAQMVLKALNDGTRCPLGPLVSAETALEGLYERTDFLTNAGIEVELLWVKGHSNSRGNCLADEVADRAVKSQIRRRGHTTWKPELTSDADVPDNFKQMGQDWADEWLYRANPHQGWKRKRTMCTWMLELSDKDEPTAPRASPELQVSGEDSAGDPGGFMIPETNHQSSLILDELIFNLRNQWSTIDAQIEKLEILIARNGGRGKFLQNKRQGFVDEARPLYEQRAHIQDEIDTARHTKLARQNYVEDQVGMAADEEYDEIEQGDDEGLDGEEQGIGHSLLEELNDSLLAGDGIESTDDEVEVDTDDELERQFQDDIALAQRHK